MEINPKVTEQKGTTLRYKEAYLGLFASCSCVLMGDTITCSFSDFCLLLSFYVLSEMQSFKADFDLKIQA